MIFKTNTDDFGRMGLGLDNPLKEMFNGDFFKEQNLLSDSDISAIKAYNVEIDKCVTSQTAFNRTMLNTSQQAQNVVVAANGNKVALEGMTKASKAAELGMKALSIAGNMIATMVVSWVLSEAISWLNDLAHAEENARKRSEELTSSYEDEKKNIDDSIAKYKELSEKLNDTSLSTSEVKSIKEQLLSVQDQLNKKYGAEITQIDLVNGKYDEQIKKLDTLAKKKASNYVSENYKDIQADQKYVSEKINLNKSLGFKGSQARPDDYSNAGFDLKKYIDRYDKLSAKVVNPDGQLGMTGDVNLVTNGTRQEVYDQLSQLFQDLSNDFGNSNEDVNKFKTTISGILEDSFDTDALASANDRIKKYAQAEILSNDNTSESYNNLVDAIDNYNTALSSGEGVDDAKQKLLEAKQAAEDSTKDITNSRKALQDVYNSLDSEAPIELQVEFGKNVGEDLQKSYEDTINRFKSDTSDSSSKELDSLNKQLDKQTQNLTNAKENLQNEYDKISNWGLDDYTDKIKNNTIQTKFGNVDMDKRTIIHWSDELKQTYADALASWDYDPEIGSIDTVFGGSERFGEDLNGNGWEVAFTPILPDGTFLSKDTVEEYINSILEEAYADDGKVTEDELTAIDAQGRQVGNTFVQGIFAGIDDSQNYDNNGNWAETVGRLMHFSGKFGAKQLADQEIDDTNAKLEETKKKIKEVSKGFDDSKKIKDFFDTEGINTQEEIDSFNDVTKNAKTAEEAIKAYTDAKKEANETNETTISLADINKTKSGIGGLFDKYEQNEGYLSQDEVASILEENPEYVEYLIKVGDQYKLNEQALNDWNEANKEQKDYINNQMGGNNYLENYSSLLDNIKSSKSHVNGGVGNTGIGEQLDDLISKNKKWNESLKNGEISASEYFSNISNSITDSGLEEALHSLNGQFDDTTDYIEETVSALSTEISDALVQSSKRFIKGETDVSDYVSELKEGTEAQKKLLAATYDLETGEDGYAKAQDGASDSIKEAIKSYNQLVDAQTSLSNSQNFVDVLSQNADFLSSYTDTAGNLLDSVMDDSRFSNYINSMSQSIVDFANTSSENMAATAQWLSDTAGISVDEASSLIAQGGESVQGAVGASLSGVQSMTSFAMSNVSGSITNASQAIGNVLSSLGSMISNFKYKITATPKITGNFGLHKDKNGIPDGLTLPTFGFDIKGSGGGSVKNFASSLKSAGSYFSNLGNQQAAAQAMNINSYKPKGTTSGAKTSKYRPTYTAPSSSKSGSGSGSGSSQEPQEKDYNWIETLISRVERNITNLGKTVSATYKTWSTRNNALAQELNAVNGEISTQQAAYNKYMQLANSVGLSENYASLVRNGTLDVSTIADDDLNDKIEKYQNYYNKALEASDAVQDLQDKLAELAKTRFDNVNSEYEAQLKQIDHSINMYDKMIDTAETQGYIASQKYYNALISTEGSNISKLQLQYSSLTSARNEAMKAGNIAEYSEEWYSMTDSINSVEEAIQDANKSLIEYKNNLRQVNWDFFDKQEDYISKLQDESDWLIDLITTENKLFNSDNGKITSSGKAVEGLHAINYNAYMTQADDYAKEIKKIDAEIANDPANTTLIERRQELLEQQRDMIKSAEDEKSAIKDLVSDGYDALSEALKKIADNYLDTLNAQKDLYDYAKTIREQTKAVAQYEKQLEAIKNDTSEETKAQIQQIKVKLEDAKQDLADSEYNQWISDQQNIIDTFESELEDWINSRLDDLDELVQNVIDQTNTSASEINDVIEKEAGDVGYTVSDAISKVMDVDSTNGTNMVNFYDKTFPNEMTTTRNSIDAIKNLLQAMKDAADKKAQEEIKKQQAAQQAISRPASSSSSSSSSFNSNSSNSGSSSGSSGWGSWFVHKADSYPKSKLRINSSIVDRLKLHNFDSSQSARSGYYKAMGGSGTYVGSASQNNWMISEMKKHGFKQGGTIGKLIRSTGEDGFVLGRTGEEILSKEKLIMLKDALQYIPQNFNIASTSLPKFTQKASNSSVDVKVDFGGITMNGVNNPEEFVTELQKSKRFEKIVQSITVDTAMGKNSLGKYRF